ncbi:MAG: hypothetical protein V3V03_09535, partial [Hyphomonadaceae bacterium]
QPVPETHVSADPVTAPVVVTGAPVNDGAELDERPDFDGRALPPAHMPAAGGSDQVSADAVFAPAPKPEEIPGEETGAGFANLFGWRRGEKDEDGAEAEVDIPETIISSPDDHPEAAPFDDADLEIPAFLRRSANH